MTQINGNIVTLNVQIRYKKNCKFMNTKDLISISKD